MTEYLTVSFCILSWFITAKGLYLHWAGDGHGGGWQRCPREHGDSDTYNRRSYVGCCLDEVRGMPNGGAAFLAMGAALAFPLVWATVLVRWRPSRLRLMRSARGGVRLVRKTQVLAGKALEVAEREALDD